MVRARYCSVSSSIPKATTACGNHSGVSLDVDTWPRANAPQANLAIAEVRNAMKTKPANAERISIARRIGAGAFFRRITTRIWPPTRSVMAAPKVNEAAIRYEEYSQAIEMVGGKNGRKFDKK